MIGVIISAIKIIVILGVLVFIHEGGHFIVAKLSKVKVNEFAIGFGPTIFTTTKGETKYALRLIPLGGFVDMEGEATRSDVEGSFSKASIWKRIAIVSAGAIVNIIFGLLVYFILVASKTDISNAFIAVKNFILLVLASLKQLFTGGMSADQMVGIVGISDIVASTSGLTEYFSIMASISVSLGVTNLLPIPPLDGSKILIYLIEAIRRKPLKEETELKIQNWGLAIIIAIFIFVTYNDIIRIF